MTRYGDDYVDNNDEVSVDDDDDNYADELIDHEVDNILDNTPVVAGAAVSCCCFCCG